MIIAASTWSKSLDSKQIEIIKIICSNLLQGWSPALKIMFPLQNAEYCTFNCLLLFFPDKEWCHNIKWHSSSTFPASFQISYQTFWLLVCF